MFKVRKAYIIVAIATITVVVSLLLILYIRKRSENRVSEFVSTSYGVLKAVPVDAVGLWLFKSPIALAEGLFSQNHPYVSLFNQENGLYKISNRIIYLQKSEGEFQDLSDSKLIASLHYSGKNEVSILLSISLESMNQDSRSRLIERLAEGNVGTYRNFNGATLYYSSGVILAIFRDYLLASTSPLLVESSVRHINTGASILDNSDFSEAAKKTPAEENLVFVNHIQIGKLFSGVAANKYLKYADFISKYSSWSVMSASFDKDFVRFEGRAFNLKGAGNFATAMEWSRGGEPEALYILPYNTYSLLSFSPERGDFNFSKVREYRELGKRLNPEVWRKGNEWLELYDIEEVALASIPYGGNFEWVTMARRSRENLFKRVASSIFKRGELLRDTIVKNDNPGYLSELAGSIFASCSEEYILNRGDWMISGSKNILEEFSSGRASKFSMADYISETPFAGEATLQGTPFSVTVNISGLQDSVASFFKKGVSERVGATLKKRNLGFMQYSVTPHKELSMFRLLFYAKNLEKLPTPPVEESKTGPAGWQLDSIVKIPEGPYELRNFDTGEREYLVQLKNYRLQLADKDLKGIWAIPFQTPLRGYVEQVDFYNNGKLQMLFASGNMVYLLDRTGRYVNPYPRRLERLVELGPKVYRMKDTYLIMLLHTDNSLSLYDRECRPLEAWRDIEVEETIKEFPELLEMGGNLYWILRTQLKTRIYSVNGLEITSSLGNHSLLPSTPVKRVSDAEVEVRRSDGAEIRLNLETGDLKKLKKRR